MRILITGTRKPSHLLQSALTHALGELDPENDILILGGAPGIDTLAEDFWRFVDGAFFRFPAQWKKQGRSAGPRRNARMLKESMPIDCVIAFPGPESIGTLDMLEKAKGFGLTVKTVVV